MTTVSSDKAVHVAGKHNIDGETMDFRHKMTKWQDCI
jgi:hypothetical protein